MPPLYYIQAYSPNLLSSLPCKLLESLGNLMLVSSVGVCVMHEFPT